MLSHLPNRRDEQAVSDDVADALVTSYETSAASIQHVNSYELPSTEKIASLVEQCRALIFPGFVGASLARATPTELRDHVRERVDELRNGLRKQIYRDLHHRVQRRQGTSAQDCPRCAAAAAEITSRFLADLVALRETLSLDVRAAYDGDPAAKDHDEIIFCYPGLYAITVYRIANALLRGGARLIPRIMTELAHEKTGIDIHPGATIGKSFFIDHGTGVVVGETSVIGDRVRLYQGVTLGALSVTRGAERPVPGTRRHPTIEDDVVIYAGATILGGDTVIGRGSVIGGNCWVTASVPPHTTLTVGRCNASANFAGADRGGAAESPAARGSTSPP
ncbi:serine O-acetyltransferase EpsC [Haliangium sp.]|uniref:serine O-acetyltransferase EpsC n=1 Tax=Haliangium sp. TaxID=2663208 RepID=UPI003D14C141